MKRFVLKPNVSFSLKQLSFRIFLCFFVFVVSTNSKVTAQQVAYKLSELESKSLFITENRTVSSLPDKYAVRVSAAEGSGVAWIKNTEFSKGTIEVDLRGKDIKQGSFLGIAFHGTSKNDCEVIYFRPFNFVAKDSLPRMHMVQYVLDTTYGWERLRDEHPGVYENKVLSPPAPNDWFHVKIEVQKELIKVYVNNSPESCLEVRSLNKKKSGKIGLWVGNFSDGDFANLAVKTN
ncbi:protein of unknown function [Chitinophaga sp. CF118]|uniref:family 16 glycoside hydrolase n=1 Tax=Chitinophaga sp. CF118 TaxID=1884367 RepID=UPI0008F2C6B6|nr:family 16 glycoside hydrolase [Chitinophaga sp. CF118]SFF09360.1 protein of unknown function [Chitinophaga sp. CF118]